MNRKKIHWSRTSPGRNKQRGLLGGLLALAMLIPGGVAMAADTDGGETITDEGAAAE